MCKTLLIIAMVFAVTSCNSAKKNKITENWQLLFNGKNLDGWVAKINHHDLGDNFANTFRVVDGKIQVNYDGYDNFNEQFGHLFYQKPFSSYHLKFDYKFTHEWREDAPDYAYRNSGIMFHSQDPKTILKDQAWPISIEYQILADADDGNLRPTGNMCSPGTDVYFKGELVPQHCMNSSSKTYGLNEWITGELIVIADSLIIHLVNGDTVLQYTKPHIGNDMVNAYHSTVVIAGQPLTQGYIALQSEGQGIEFKNIMIKELR